MDKEMDVLKKKIWYWNCKPD